ncbi:MAG: hypothetical protein JST36_10535 [Bacteroidetes bacterium]|nr:hypothetical protein [Bacteroidota bacterium]
MKKKFRILQTVFMTTLPRKYQGAKLILYVGTAKQNLAILYTCINTKNLAKLQTRHNFVVVQEVAESQ